MLGKQIPKLGSSKKVKLTQNKIGKYKCKAGYLDNNGP